jgi:nucleoid-associated protein YgaU
VSNTITERLKNSEQTISFILGILVVLVVGSLIFRYFSQRSEMTQVGEVPSSEQTASDEALAGETALPYKYTVQTGDHLWAIAEKYYGSGYNWTDIAQANELVNPNGLAVGQELIIPDVQAKEATVLLAEVDSIEGSNYMVKEGDSLSKIALRAYSDIYEWEKIYEANLDKISNPSIIYPGQELTIPR